MITAMPDIQTLAITEEVEFVVLACDGIWYEYYSVVSVRTCCVCTSNCPLKHYCLCDDNVSPHSHSNAMFILRNSKTSQEVIDFVRCRLSERTHDRPPTSDDLVGICESVSVCFVKYNRT